MFTVTITIQSPGNDPVTMPYARNVSAVSAVATVAQVIAQYDETPDMPESIRTTLLSVNVTAN